MHSTFIKTQFTVPPFFYTSNSTSNTEFFFVPW